MTIKNPAVAGCCFCSGLVGDGFACAVEADGVCPAIDGAADFFGMVAVEAAAVVHFLAVAGACAAFVDEVFCAVQVVVFDFVGGRMQGDDAVAAKSEDGAVAGFVRKIDVVFECATADFIKGDAFVCGMAGGRDLFGCGFDAVLAVVAGVAVVELDDAAVIAFVAAHSGVARRVVFVKVVGECVVVAGVAARQVAVVPKGDDAVAVMAGDVDFFAVMVLAPAQPVKYSLVVSKTLLLA